LHEEKLKAKKLSENSSDTLRGTFHEDLNKASAETFEEKGTEESSRDYINEEKGPEENESAATTGEGEQGEESPASGGETQEDPAKMIEALQAELAETQDRLLRIHAEFDNYRKRVNKEKEEWIQYSCMGLVEKLLPVLDNFDLAMASLEQQSEETKNTFTGITMIIKQLQEILQKEGLQPIEALGKEFNPVYHEAVMQAPAEEGMVENQIVEEFRKGYLFKDKVLRASMVKVVQKG
jgi:molecular chaperone GrpE